MNAILGGFDLRQARALPIFAAPARLIAALGHRCAAARTRQIVDSLAPRQRRDAFCDSSPSGIGPRVDADAHAVRMLMHIGR